MLAKLKANDSLHIPLHFKEPRQRSAYMELAMELATVYKYRSIVHYSSKYNSDDTGLWLMGSTAPIELIELTIDKNYILVTTDVVQQPKK